MYKCSPELVPQITSEPDAPGLVTTNESWRHWPPVLCRTPLPAAAASGVATPFNKLIPEGAVPSEGSPMAKVVKSNLS
jgi:hypothetical protein